MSEHQALELFSQLLLPSLSGDEIRVASAIKSHLNLLGYPTRIDSAGNVIVELPGSNPKADHIVLAAHMDEIGMLVTSVEGDGSLRVTRSGGLHPWKLGEGPVDIFGDLKICQGVLSMGSTHTKDAAGKTITWEDVKIITGLNPGQLLDAGIRPGSPVLPSMERRGPVIFGSDLDPLVGAWTFDDRMGCVALLRLLQLLKEQDIQPINPTIIAFTTREEVGGQGAKYLARSLNPKIFISIDGCPITPGSNLHLDGRPGIWVKDRIAHYDRELIQEFINASNQAGIGLQLAVYDSAASDASLVSYALGVPRITCIGHVRENSHGFEVARLSVFDNLLKILLIFIKNYQG